MGSGRIGVEHVLHMHQEPRLSEVVVILREDDVGGDENCRMDDFFLADGKDYNARSTIEQRIEEMKNDLHADGFCTKTFYATESTFLAVLLSYNLLSQVTRQSGYRKPSTMRAAVFVGGAILGRKGRDIMVRFSKSWGGLKNTFH